MTRFEAYVPTRTAHSFEVRVQSSNGGALCLFAGNRQAMLETPNIVFKGRFFYRHTFDSLPADTIFSIAAVQDAAGARSDVTTSTLAEVPGALKLNIGVLSDLHMPRTQTTIEAYRPGTRRFTGLSEALTRRYIRRLETLGADIIVLPGDLVEPCDPGMLDTLNGILRTVSIPCYPVIGNHEPWSPGGEGIFYKALGLPADGFYDVVRNGVRLLMLSTPDPSALGQGSPQRAWLKERLDRAAPDEDVILVSHFSLLLHPCVDGPRNDGYQLIDNHRDILTLIEGYPNVRLFLAGHKNVPSVVMRHGILHTLSPQLIQAPTAYDMFRLYEGGIQRTTYEIDEQHYADLARAAYTHDWPMRYGSEHGRNFSILYRR